MARATKLLMSLQATVLLISASFVTGADFDANSNSDYAPRLVETLRDSSAELNKPHSFECSVDAQPDAQVFWFKDNASLAANTPASNNAQHVKQLGKELMFLAFKHSDAGSYHCEASNYLGSVRSAQFNIAPKAEQTDKLVARPLAKTLAVGESVQVACLVLDASDLSAVVKSAATLVWTRNDKPIVYTTAAAADDTNAQQPPVFEASARRVRENEFVLTMLAPATLADNESKFTCQLLLHSADTTAEPSTSVDVERIKESQAVFVYVDANLAPPPPPLQDLSGNMAPPLDNLVHSNPQIHSNNSNRTTNIDSFHSNSVAASGGRRSSLEAAFVDAVKWLQSWAWLAAVVAFVVLFAILLPRTYNSRRKYNNYLKQEQQYNSSASSSSLKVEPSSTIDPYLCGFMPRSTCHAAHIGALSSPLLADQHSALANHNLGARTLSARAMLSSNSNLSCDNNNNNIAFVGQLPPPLLSSSTAANALLTTNRQTSASQRRQASYRTQLRKVADSSDNDSSVISPYAVSSICGQLEQQQPQNHMHNSHMNTGRHLPPILPQRPASLSVNNAHEMHRRSISNGSTHQQQPPPPITAEAMRALQEQFDINQLVAIDERRCELPQSPSSNDNYNNDDDDDDNDNENDAHQYSSPQ